MDGGPFFSAFPLRCSSFQERAPLRFLPRQSPLLGHNARELAEWTSRPQPSVDPGPLRDVSFQAEGKNSHPQRPWQRPLATMQVNGGLRLPLCQLQVPDGCLRKLVLSICRSRQVGNDQASTGFADGGGGQGPISQSQWVLHRCSRVAAALSGCRRESGSHLRGRKRQSTPRRRRLPLRGPREGTGSLADISESPSYT